MVLSDRRIKVREIVESTGISTYELKIILSKSRRKRDRQENKYMKMNFQKYMRKNEAKQN